MTEYTGGVMGLCCILCCCRYCQSRDAVRSRYYSIRNAKLTRWQKVKYGSLAVVILFILSVILLTLLDLYLEDYASAKYRLAVIWWCICTTVQFLWDMSVIGATYAWHGTQYAAEKTWHGSKIAAHYGLVGAEFTGRQIYAGSLVAAQYAVVGSKIVAEYAVEGAEITARCTWIGCKHSAIIAYRGLVVLLDCALFCMKVCWEYAYAATLVGGHYAAEGGKLSVEYAAKGCVYAYEHGTTAVKHGSVCFYHYAIYFVTNFRKASAEAAVSLSTTLQAVVVATCSAAYSGGQLLLRCTADLLYRSYELVWLVSQWLYAASISAAHLTSITVTNVITFSKEFAIAAVRFTISTCVTAYNATVATAIALYSGSVSVCEWSVSTAKVTWTWLTTTVVTFSNFLYVAVTEYGFHWAVMVGSWLFDVACFLGHVLCKFFGDLGAYVANFVYITSSRILSIVYIIVSFIYSIAMAIASVIRVVLDVIVFCTTRMFGAIIWFLRETLFAYMYMLHQYNIYRELLFMIFIGLLTVYCTGLMRDRRRLVEVDDAESSDGSDEEHADDTVMAESGQKEPVKSQPTKDSTLSEQLPVMPSHEEVDDDLSDIELPDQIEDVEERGLEEEDLTLSDEHGVLEE